MKKLYNFVTYFYWNFFLIIISCVSSSLQNKVIHVWWVLSVVCMGNDYPSWWTIMTYSGLLCRNISLNLVLIIKFWNTNFQDTDFSCTVIGKKSRWWTIIYNFYELFCLMIMNTVQETVKDRYIMLNGSILAKKNGILFSSYEENFYLVILVSFNLVNLIGI